MEFSFAFWLALISERSICCVSLPKVVSASAVSYGEAFTRFHHWKCFRAKMDIAGMRTVCVSVWVWVFALIGRTTDSIPRLAVCSPLALCARVFMSASMWMWMWMCVRQRLSVMATAYVQSQSQTYDKILVFAREHLKHRPFNRLFVVKCCHL